MAGALMQEVQLSGIVEADFPAAVDTNQYRLHFDPDS
jgi:hypothetical protein